MTKDEFSKILDDHNAAIVPKDWAINALISMDKLAKIERIVNDPLVKAFGSIGTAKIREVLEQ